MYLVKWNLATGLLVYRGKVIVEADSSGHAMDMVRNHIGDEGQAASIDVSPINGPIYEMSRSETIVDGEYSAPLPDMGGGELFAFELAARGNVVAGSEKAAWSRFSNCVKNGVSDGKYCKLYRGAVLEKESFLQMSSYERMMLERKFQRVQGGGVNPR